ncbi:unnamed protein product [Candida verbasci]|uniref:TRIP4/RQT4 C2HC5-type zinc finger domain-containing protein n=1 Tax=Candida verbasci TaxID=1227364 RepID=A0A9W4XJJ2_9ASCO|nr:unnamed protein product [Candida verbasci]
MNKSKTTSQLIKDRQLTIEEKKLKKKNLTNLKDIESVLNNLELNESESSARVCNCMARRHPLFEIAPNCLNCGKIICSKEGLQPCSFCGSNMISNNDKQDIIKLLQHEKSEILNKPQIISHQPTAKKKQKQIVVKMNPGEKFWEAQDRAFKLAESEKQKQRQQQQEKEEEEPVVVLKKDVESDSDLVRAQENLNTLLHYQETGEERTKIIDNASDFEFPSQSIWLSPEERALNLKKQQRLNRELGLEKERSKRGERIVEMSITKDGKVKMIEKYIALKEEKSRDEINLENEIKKSKQAQQNTNNLVWDYEKDAKRWEKPIYFTTEDRKEPKQDSSVLEVKNRVQIAKNDDFDLIATLIN